MRAMVVGAVLWASCSRERAPAGAQRVEPARGAVRELPPSHWPAPTRLVAIGDAHGDLDSFRRALRVGAVLDDGGHWVGGTTVLVQTGDVLDRGETERAIMDLLLQLRDEASHAGGAVVALNGNHEVMNVQGDFRYVTPGGFGDFGGTAERRAAFAPGGSFARRLAEQDTVVVVGDSVFVHGGLRVADVDRGLDAMNSAVRAWMLGTSGIPDWLSAEDSPVWLRTQAFGDDPDTCGQTHAMLASLHARRLVIGHTVQPHGINAGCAGEVVRIDVGLARLYGGPIEVLEIRGGVPQVLDEHGRRDVPSG